ncbi:MAG: SRPBCC family protein [Myxococcales bacterium]|nr:SRPBCC family protein [Myxococcales bacterium]
MPGFETVDRLEINAPAQRLFDIVLDYPRMHEWYPRNRVELIDGGDVVEGARLSHVLSPAGSPVKSRFTRTIQRIKPPNRIEESYDSGDLIGSARWEFEAVSEAVTRVSFYCQVRSNSLLMHIGFALGGEKGHNRVYQQILAALKARAEASPA